MVKDLKFECSGCGCCCNRIADAVANTSHIPAFKFPYKWDENGRCEMLSSDNSCNVYEDRPLLCNVEKVAEHLGLNKKSFYKKNHKACLLMQDIDKVEDKFRLKL